MERFQLGERVRASDIGMKDENLLRRPSENGISEVIETASCSQRLELAQVAGDKIELANELKANKSQLTEC